ncbi:hypothetical protein EIP91_007174 [Steccherinum ochraceum]|uniref:HMG box domain-containing protein n=1 Tax=Steccherinum ochraceum TaxID=92696 RepID=A0A4R0RLF8_9APHY|nr:hypothetical protein EIP91_007174 [Steccherinum ochraceum]
MAGGPERDGPSSHQVLDFRYKLYVILLSIPFATPFHPSPITYPASLAHLPSPVVTFQNMPADRTRGSKRNAAEGLDSTWSVQIDAPKQQGIAFAPNVTPGTFNDPPSPTDVPSESMLFPLSVNEVSGKRNGHSKKKPENHIPRPPNAFILFRSSFIKGQVVTSDVETNHSTLSKIVGLTWAKLPHEERQKWHAMAKAAQEEHKRKYPEYAFRPLHSKGKAENKRKVREVGPKDMTRCARIAELLVEGKKGEQLSEAIAEFDKHHVPQIITRFEAPITARAYRRSSSAPVPDTEPKPTFLSASSPRRMSKPRATSTEPPSPLTEGYSDCQSPSSSQGDSDYFYESPSPSSLATMYTLPSTNPSFETFSFNATVAAPSDSCDPFSVNNQSQESLFDAFSNSSSAPRTPVHDMFDTSSLSLNTSQFGNFGVGSSPYSSMPSTPQDYSSSSAHLLSGAEVPAMQAGDHFSANFDLFMDPNYSCGYHQPMTDPFVAQDFSTMPKSDFSYYERTDLAGSYHESAQSTYLPPIPAYGL